MIRVVIETGDMKQLVAGYRNLPRALARKHTRAALRRVAATFVPDFKRAAVRGATGKLRRSAAAYARSKGDTATSRVGYFKGGWYARLVSEGTKDRYTKRSGAYRGRITGSRFADAPLQKSSSVGATLLASEMARGLEAAARELPRYLAARKR